MALMKYAKASLVKPYVSSNEWSSIRNASTIKSSVPENLIDRASKIFGHPFDPGSYLLSHATIVASVDVYEPPNVRLGSVMENGFKVNRKYGTYRITPSSQQWINNNNDAWSRPVLLKSFRTFIGAHNFVEHVQVEELSKGRIIDAAIRDIEGSLYVDILIATDRKHEELVRAIESGKMGTLSMGCSITGSQCTKCGHWAADETEMCGCIKYMKGNTFFDEMGRTHKVAELCGHESIDPTAGVTFVEGSWVGTPAFTGAVLRNIIDVHGSDGLGKAASEMLDVPPEQWTVNQQQRAASLAFGQNSKFSGWDDFGEESGEGEAEGEGGGEESAEAEKNPLDSIEDELAEHLRSRVMKRLKKDMEDKKTDDALEAYQSTDSNDNIVKQSRINRKAKERADRIKLGYRATRTFLMKTSKSDVDFFNNLALLDQQYGVDLSVDIYRAACKVGSLEGYSTKDEFLRACGTALGRKPSTVEAREILRLGKLNSLRGQGSGERN